ncbi:hypothetical protein [Sphingobium chungbukense]|uniref:hypothetical protein n=1 Tax=Sphingobium chungbukense TaxID=56193 RepID=UPI000A9FBECA|nr:hypothetical protein [Sphingobium chungbukense]
MNGPDHPNGWLDNWSLYYDELRLIVPDQEISHSRHNPIFGGYCLFYNYLPGTMQVHFTEPYFAIQLLSSQGIDLTHGSYMLHGSIAAMK